MRTPVDIYEKYRIPPWQQEHQLRVAAVGAMLARRIHSASEEDIVLAGLFHDMGNILKTDFSPEGPLLQLIGEENCAYWQTIKVDFAARYGTNESDATDVIVQEIGLPESVRASIHSMGFSKILDIFASGSIEQHIIEYADQRVGPYGVLSLDERIAEGQIRYKGRYGELGPEEIERREKIIAAAREMERIVCERAHIRPEDITDASITPIIEELRAREIA